MSSQSGPVKIYMQEIRMPRPGERFATNERVLDAVDAIANGNRLITSRALLQCRIAEIRAARAKESKDFDVWTRKFLRVP